VTRVFDRIAVIGLGLLGGSLARAAKHTGAAGSVAAATRSQSAIASALRDGAVDTVGTPEEVVRDVDLVVLATPISAMASMTRRIASRMRRGSLLTDVGSVKAVLHETLPGLLPPGVDYIGSHPMAGSHERGFEYSRADLFRDEPCIVADTGPEASRRTLCDFWRALGARVTLRDPAVHDAEVAWMSHVPHVVAYAFAEALGVAPANARHVAGAGFRDFTRIARSEPELWGDILTANRKAVSAPLQAVADALARLGRAIEANDADALERQISAAREALSRFSVGEDSDHAGAGEGHPNSDPT
jgi:cyclohexadieny/prephenate dehydrogenase